MDSPFEVQLRCYFVVPTCKHIQACSYEVHSMHWPWCTVKLSPSRGWDSNSWHFFFKILLMRYKMEADKYFEDHTDLFTESCYKERPTMRSLLIRHTYAYIHVSRYDIPGLYASVTFHFPSVPAFRLLGMQKCIGYLCGFCLTPWLLLLMVLLQGCIFCWRWCCSPCKPELLPIL